MRRVAVAVLVAVAVAVVGACGDDGASGVDNPTGGDVAGIELTYLDGSTGALTDYAGTPLVVNFFASWCGPCKAELPDIEAVHEALGDEVAFLGIATRDIDSESRRMADDAGVTYDLASDPGGEIITELEGIGMPTTVLIDRDGNIVANHTGALTESELRSLIDDKLLA